MSATALELRDDVVAHPWEAIALAFAAGAYVAFDRTGSARRTVLTSLGATAIATLRALIRRSAPAPRSWIDQSTIRSA